MVFKKLVTGLGIIISISVISGCSDGSETPDVTNLTVREARDILNKKDITFDERALNKDDGSIWNANNWVVCSQSTEEDKTLTNSKKVVLSYARKGECPLIEESENSETINMPEVVGLTVNDARDKLKFIEYEELPHHGDEGSIWDSSNWIVCSQSIEKGDVISKDQKITITYTEKDGSCEAFDKEKYIKQFSKKLKAHYGHKGKWEEAEDYSILKGIKKITSKGEGLITIHFNKGFRDEYDLQFWADNMAEVVNDQTPEFVSSISIALIGKDNNSKEIDSSITDATKDGLTRRTARDLCETAFNFDFPYDSKIRWIVGLRSETNTGSSWQFWVDVKIQGVKGLSLKCSVEGTETNPVLTSYEIS